MAEKLHGYQLKTPFQTQNAGFSRWAVAAKQGREYVLKEFFNPIYPDEGTLSESMRQTRIRDCEEYEREREALYAAINRVADGNIVKVHEFFRHDSHYYLATPRIPEPVTDMKQIAALEPEQKILLCRTAAHSLAQLHSAGIVHSDIKDSNLLVKKTASGNYTAKLLDFDCSFFADSMPEDMEELGGDQVYLAPEACRFLCGDEVDLTCKMDVFSLGLLFHQYLTGELPGFDAEEYGYAHEAVLSGSALTIPETVPAPLRELLERMLESDPERRCSAAEAFEALGAFLPDQPPEPEPEPEPESPADSLFTAAGDL